MKVFLDTTVILDFLKGDPSLKDIFSPKIMNKVSYAINPIVLQEILLSGRAASKMSLDEFTKDFEVIPVDIIKSEEFLERIRSLRNRIAHANDLLILGSAQSCDYLVTTDRTLQQLGNVATVKVITPEEFLNLLGKQK